VTFFDTGVATVLANESDFPGRVERAPLDDSDRALGFTGGRVVRIDGRARNEGRSVVESLDAQFDWTLPIGTAGELRAYGIATWYLSQRRRTTPGAAWVEHVDYFGGPLAWRGNLGIEWRNGPLLIGLNVQYYDSYRATYPIDNGQFVRNPELLAFQGAARIPSQAYVDLFVRRSFDLQRARPLDRIEVNFGVQNLLDQRPPTVADPALSGYSFYGDPRRRRLALVLSGHF
jgi:outer membrane receptor protein involved in Fe transport